MGYRTISLSDEAYERLASLKRKGESFTDLIMRLSEGACRKPLLSFAGAWEMVEGEESKIFKEIGDMWRKYEKDLLGH
ncbi:MAG: antitoxin VapB family protein [Candidatus Methanosuratincola sp.]